MLLGLLLLLIRLVVLTMLGCLLDHLIELLLRHLDDRQLTHLRMSNDSRL